MNEILRWRGDVFNIHWNDVPLQISTVRLSSVYSYLGLTWIEVRENDPIEWERELDQKIRTLNEILKHEY